MNALGLSLAACAATAAGGVVAWIWRERMEGALAFRVGVLLGVAATQLLPESLTLARAANAGVPLTLMAAFTGFIALRAVGCVAERRGTSTAAGWVAALPMVGHSLLDGAGIGLAFQASPALGASVAAAVVAHDFCDGLNTVGLMAVQRQGAHRALAVLALDAAAPAVGAFAAVHLAAPPAALSAALGLLGGGLLHVALFDLLRRVVERGRAQARWRPPALLMSGLILALALPHGLG